MSTDLFVRKEVENGTDDKGRRMFSKVEVANFGNCRNIVDIITWKYEIANCSSIFLSADEVLEVKDKLEEELEDIKNGTVDSYKTCTYRNESMSDEDYKKACEDHRQRDIDSLMNDIDEITSLIEEEHITEDSDACYEFHLWY